MVLTVNPTQSILAITPPANTQMTMFTAYLPEKAA